MSSRLRRYAILIAILLMASILMAIGATLFLRGEFTKIEQQQVSQSVERVVNAANNRADTISSQSADWAHWDDTYAFVGNHNKDYITLNMNTTSLQTFGINFMLFFNKQGTFVDGIGLDADSQEETPLPKDLITSFTPQSGLLANSDNSVHSGFLSIDGKPLVFVSQAILTSELKGPYNGTLVFAQYLEPKSIQKMANMMDLTLSYEVVDGASTTTDVQAIRASLSSKTPTVKPLSNNLVAGYQLINDVHGKPLFVARVEQRRDTYHEAQRALMYYLAASIGVVMLAQIMAIYSTRQAVAKDETIRIKDEFFSMASHELRTPLTAIRGNSQLLKQIYGSSNDEDFNRITTDIHTSSERLIRLVTNFLDLARLEQNRIPLTITNFSLKEALVPIIDELQTIASDKSITLELSLPDSLPQVAGDQDRVKQVVYNLIGNSLKFTDKGSVSISAIQQGTMVSVAVTDTGRGISPEGQKILFKKFQQAKTSDAQKGSGLGLYISKVMVEKMGGTIKLESSEENKGTTISFTIPQATTPAETSKN